MTKISCDWVLQSNQLYQEYHDNEWGVPQHNDQKLFELLILEGVQAGLSWSTILNKRENYRKAFDNFDFEKIALYNDEKIKTLLRDTGIVRNKLKVLSARANAKVFIEIKKEFGSFDKYLWSYVNGKPIKNQFKTLKDFPAKTELSDKISKDLKKRGFKFVGSTVIYATMQAIGMVNDHVLDCFKRN